MPDATTAGVGGGGGGVAAPAAVTGPSAAETPFLDRERELAALEESLHRAIAGQGRMVLIDGEPGIGKTRLVGELLRLTTVADRFARTPAVVTVRCWEGAGAPSLWPWIRVLRELITGADPDRLRGELGPGAGWLAALVPELTPLVPGVREAPALDSEQSRFVLFDALASFLRRRSEHEPLVIAIEDIHDADDPSLLALLFLSRQLTRMRVLVLVTHRTAEVRRSDRLAAIVALLEREGLRLSLSGLEPADLSRLVLHRQGGLPGAELAVALHEATGGNPFFVEEAIRLLGDRGIDALVQEPLVPLSEGVRAVLNHRLDALGPQARGILQVAAVIGSRFGAAVLASAADRPAAEVIEALERAAADRLLRSRDDGVGAYEFAHALIRECALAGLSGDARRAAHAAVATALERRYAGSVDAHLEELAHHFLSAVPHGDAGRALDYAERAAGHAMSIFAHERAARLYTAALDVVELLDEPSAGVRAARRARLLLGRGRALVRLGDPDGRRALGEAALAARAAADAELIAAVALARAAFSLSPGVVEGEVTGLLEEALDAIPQGDSPLRVQLMSTLARARYWEVDERPRRELAERALAMARRLGDSDALALALGNAIPALNGPANADEQLEWIDELLALPAAPGELAILARSLEIDRLVERGALGAADASIEGLARQAERLRDVRAAPYVPLHRSRRRAMSGDFEAAYELLDQAAAAAERLEQSTFPLTIVGGHVSADALRGRFERVEERAAPLTDRLPAMPVWRACLTVGVLGQGQPERARRELARVVAGGVAAIPRDSQWLITIALAAEAAATLGERHLAQELGRELEPFAGHNAISPVVGYRGPVDRTLGLVAECVGDLGAAEAHLRAALELAERQHARPALAAAAADLARVLAARGGPAAAREVEGLLAQAGRIADELGLENFAVPSPGSPPWPGATPGIREPAVPFQGVLAREGEVWTMALGASTVRVRDSKGVRQLATLLARPEQEIHVLELARGEAGGQGDPAAAAATAAGLLSVEDPAMGAGPALDDAAKAAYRRRIADLREEIDEAERWNDPERRARATAELEFLGGELAAAVGLGGRDRPQAAAAERARVNVTRAIRTSIRRIAEADAVLGAELEGTVRTGVFCAYTPDLRRPIRWTVRETG